MNEDIVLYDYWRSSASYRVRIALQNLGLPFKRIVVDLLRGEQRSFEHRDRNPQGLVPVLSIDGRTLTQSLAIIEYLAETRSASFLPADPFGKNRVRTLSYAIAMEIHPVCNLGVVSHIQEITGGGDTVRNEWIQKYIGDGLRALEALLDDPATGIFSHGDTPTMADFCLLPQVFNAERWGINLLPFKNVRRIADTCRARGDFAAAHPDAVRPR